MDEETNRQTNGWRVVWFMDWSEIYWLVIDSLIDLYPDWSIDREKERRRVNEHAKSYVRLALSSKITVSPVCGCQIA